ncbi:MAG: complex I NDUFA9 subunit family protein [Alphaproteobacteria bacterium]|jgi:NADH dehydrogenase|nr:complex I NDUFA9 subunit family protein [Alphaproteobacteria bacterium]
MALRNVTVFGGSGFLGRHLVRRLAQTGARIRVAVRDPEAAAFLKPMGDVGQIVSMLANVRNQASVARAVEGAEAVLNLVGILSQWGGQRFDAVQGEGAGNVAAASAAAGVGRLVHVSAIGADADATSAYARSKAVGEVAVAEAFPGATIVRPSVIFGPEDSFFNLFGALLPFTPVLPLIGGGQTRFQPVYVGDVAEAMQRILERPESAGQTFELGGPRVYTFEELMRLILEVTGRRRFLVPVPFAVAKFEATFLQLWPEPILTRDQVELLRHDNVAAEGAPGFEALDIAPHAAEAMLESYMYRYRRAGKRIARHLA